MSGVCGVTIVGFVGGDVSRRFGCDVGLDVGVAVAFSPACSGGIGGGVHGGARGGFGFGLVLLFDTWGCCRMFTGARNHAPYCSVQRATTASP